MWIPCICFSVFMIYVCMESDWCESEVIEIILFLFSISSIFLKWNLVIKNCVFLWLEIALLIPHYSGTNHIIILVNPFTLYHLSCFWLPNTLCLFKFNISHSFKDGILLPSTVPNLIKSHIKKTLQIIECISYGFGSDTGS